MLKVKNDRREATLIGTDAVIVSHAVLPFAALTNDQVALGLVLPTKYCLTKRRVHRTFP